MNDANDTPSPVPISASERPGSDPYADLLAAVAQLEPDAVRALAYLANRLLSGQGLYGKIDLETDKRDFRKERGEEIADLLVYSAFIELTKVVKR